MVLLDLLVLPEAVLGCILGLLAAGLVHWLSPAPEPVVLEAGLVAAGFIGGMIVHWLTETRKEGHGRR
jgi:Na+/glutamate symporter